MRFPFRAFVLLNLLTFSFSASQAQTQVGTPADISQDQKVYKFESSTVWGHVKAVVRDTPGGFQVGVKSDATVSGWVLKDEKSGQVLSKGGLNPANQLSFQTKQPFQGSYRLTLYLNTDREQVPVMVRLVASTKGGAVPQATVVSTEGLTDFEDNPDRPYNIMVKNLYEKALDNYSKGDNVHALSLLKKAEELDPLQPQVEALLEKIQGPSESTLGPLDEVRAALKKGRTEEAQAKLEDYLDAHPDDQEALALKDQIEGRSKPVRKAATKAKKAAIEKPTPQSSEAIQAKADQAYNLGLDSYRQGDYAAAKKFWEETLQIQPTHLQAQRNLERLKEDHPDLK